MVTAKSSRSKNYLLTLVLLGLATPLVVFNLYSAANTTFGFATATNGTIISAGTKAVSANTGLGALTSYGLSLDNSGYQTLLQYDGSIDPNSLSPENQAILKKLLGRNDAGKPILPHPCCPASISECAPCGHGAAIRGLIKYLLQQGWSENDILQESLVWDRLFFPGKV